MLKPLEQYSTFIFDCDGVILNSNSIKSTAFYEVVKGYGYKKAKALLDYHILNGGISRYKKFEYFVGQILGKDLDDSKHLINSLVREFGDIVLKKLLNCEVSPSLKSLRQLYPQSNWLIVSGGDQSELEFVFRERNLAHVFNCGIFGSPNTKETIIEREIFRQTIQNPAIFFGDSRLDYEVAKQFDIDFAFVYGWSEMKEWDVFFKDKSVKFIKNLQELVY